MPGGLEPIATPTAGADSGVQLLPLPGVSSSTAGDLSIATAPAPGTEASQPAFPFNNGTAGQPGGLGGGAQLAGTGVAPQATAGLIPLSSASIGGIGAAAGTLAPLPGLNGANEGGAGTGGAGEGGSVSLNPLPGSAGTGVGSLAPLPIETSTNVRGGSGAAGTLPSTTASTGGVTLTEGGSTATASAGGATNGNSTVNASNAAGPAMDASLAIVGGALGLFAMLLL